LLVGTIITVMVVGFQFRCCGYLASLALQIGLGIFHRHFIVLVVFVHLYLGFVGTLPL
jgi:hypothetical protein